jgi:hypothetical protein
VAAESLQHHPEHDSQECGDAKWARGSRAAATRALPSGYV